MRKSELRTGMIVEAVNGCVYFVSIDHVDAYNSKIVDINADSFIRIDSISDRLLCRFNKRHNIIKVYEPSFKILALKIEDCKLIWERKEEVKEHTIEELIEKVGYEFKIKK